MAWVKIDDHIDQHPKIEAAGPLALALFVAGLAYCNRVLTDGWIPTTVANRLLEFGDTGRTAEDVVAALVDVGLWDVAEGGYEVHDYGLYQPTREQVEQHRARTADRMRRYRARNGQRYDATNDARNGARSGDVPGTGTGTSNTEPTEPAELTEPARAEGTVATGWQPTEQADDPFVAAHSITGRVPTGRLAEWLNEMGRDHGDAAVHEELHRQAGSVTLSDPSALRELLRRTSDALKLAAVRRNRPKPMKPKPEDEPPPNPTPEQEHAAAVMRRAISLWSKAGMKGSAEDYRKEAEQQLGAGQ